MFHHLLESSHRDDSNKWSNIGFCQEIMQVLSLDLMLILYSSAVGIQVLVAGVGSRRLVLLVLAIVIVTSNFTRPPVLVATQLFQASYLEL